MNKELYSMLRIRLVEESLAERYKENQIRCPMHLYIGQEAIAVGVSASLNNTDSVYSNHRAHGHYLAKGGSLKKMIAEMYGKKTGCCGGRGGSMHLIDKDVNFLGSTPIVGGTIPLAVGAAFSYKYLKSKSISVIYFGDGCFEEGVIHESLNFASLHRLPILFVCENNNFSVYTNISERQPQRKIFKVAEAHGLRSKIVNGNKLDEVMQKVGKSVKNIRAGNGPEFLEFTTYRWREHCGPDYDNNLGYRTQREIKNGISECPINYYKLKIGVQEQAYETAKFKILKEIKEAFRFAESSPRPEKFEFRERIYA